MKQNTIEALVLAIRDTNLFFQGQAQQQVNVALTLRNRAIGHYLVEYEQHGSDRAEYGGQLYKTVFEKLKNSGIKSLSVSTLYICKLFYNTYPQIFQTLSGKYALEKNVPRILQTLSGKYTSKNTSNSAGEIVLSGFWNTLQDPKKKKW